MAIPSKQIGDIADALIVFADVVDSSMHSAVLGYEEYAARLIEFQKMFTDLGRRYFPETNDKAVGFCRVDARGDEGIVFLASPRGARREDKASRVLRAIEFLYHLKGRLRLAAQETRPKSFDIGAGIHWGRVVLTVTEEAQHSVIGGMEGYAINYAKRVESSSREGRHSRIILSTDAVRVLELEPVVFSSFRTAMKGIGDHVELHEVVSGLFEWMELREGDEADEGLVREAEDLCGNPMAVQESWEKALAVSVLERICRESPVRADKNRCRQLQDKLAWHSVKEDDPILLFLRSRNCRELDQRTREVRYLRSILDRHPHFVHARLCLAKACWALSREKADREEKLFARDTARELLDHYADILKPEEKAEFEALLRGSRGPVSGTRRPGRSRSR